MKKCHQISRLPFTTAVSTIWPRGLKQSIHSVFGLWKPQTILSGLCSSAIAPDISLFDLWSPTSVWDCSLIGLFFPHSVSDCSLFGFWSPASASDCSLFGFWSAVTGSDCYLFGVWSPASASHLSLFRMWSFSNASDCPLFGLWSPAIASDCFLFVLWSPANCQTVPYLACGLCQCLRLLFGQWSPTNIHTVLYLACGLCQYLRQFPGLPEVSCQSSHLSVFGLWSLVIPQTVAVGLQSPANVQFLICFVISSKWMVGSLSRPVLKCESYTHKLLSYFSDTTTILYGFQMWI
jgi:hypothetical protein